VKRGASACRKTGSAYVEKAPGRAAWSTSQRKRKSMFEESVMTRGPRDRHRGALAYSRSDLRRRSQAERLTSGRIRAMTRARRWWGGKRHCAFRTSAAARAAHGRVPRAPRASARTRAGRDVQPGAGWSGASRTSRPRAQELLRPRHLRITGRSCARQEARRPDEADREVDCAALSRALHDDAEFVTRRRRRKP